MIAVSPAPSLFCFAASTITEPLDLARGGVASWPATGGVGANGSAIHRIRYRNTSKPASARNAKIQRARISVGSMAKYAASPPQTPPIFLSALERVRRFFAPVCSVATGVDCDVGKLAAAIAGIRGDDDEAAVARPESISRCSRFKSPRNSAATWKLRSRAFYSNLLLILSSSKG